MTRVRSSLLHYITDIIINTFQIVLQANLLQQNVHFRN